MQIKGQSAIISGGASGMGAATARLLASKGARVALLDKDHDKALNLAQSINGIAIECDVTSEHDLEKAIALASQQLGPARICVNCAGVAPAQRIVGREGAMPLAQFASVININLIGTFNLLRLAALAMSTLEPQGDSFERGVIINTASIAAFEGQIGQAAYSASKGGVVGMTLPAARELARFGIRVMAIAPGLVATPMLLNFSEEVQASLANQVPFPKRLGQPEEFAALVVHIVENAFLNGSVIRLDGAMRMQEK